MASTGLGGVTGGVVTKEYVGSSEVTSLGGGCVGVRSLTEMGVETGVEIGV